MKRRFVIGAAVVVALVGIGYGVHAWLYSLAHVTTDDAYVEGSVTILSAKIPGYVVDLLIDDNRPVKGGDLLLRIDPRVYHDAVVRCGEIGEALAQLWNPFTKSESPAAPQREEPLTLHDLSP